MTTTAMTPPANVTTLPPLGDDRRGRPLRSLRLSVTDRCNFRCTYCMPREVFGRDYAFLPHDALLSFDELHRIARVAVERGIDRIRLTGGEPLLRRGIEDLVARLAALRTRDGAPVDLSLTTNGAALAAKAGALREAGLSRLTVSLDSLDDARFQRLNDVRFPVRRVLDGIDAAQTAGFASIKINMVVKRGQNDQDLVAMARHFRGTGHVVRFIEYMDVGSTNGWELADVVPSDEVVRRIDAVFPLAPVDRERPGSTASRYRYRDGAGEIGLVSSVTQPFCAACDRARITADGTLFTCLFGSRGHDLRGLLRDGADDEALAQALRSLWAVRDDRYSELRSTATRTRKSDPGRVEMSRVGG